MNVITYTPGTDGLVHARRMRLSGTISAPMTTSVGGGGVQGDTDTHTNTDTHEHTRARPPAVVSVGGNDIALTPLLFTIINMVTLVHTLTLTSHSHTHTHTHLQVCCTPQCCIEQCGCACPPNTHVDCGRCPFPTPPPASKSDALICDDMI